MIQIKIEKFHTLFINVIDTKKARHAFSDIGTGLASYGRYLKPIPIRG